MDAFPQPDWQRSARQRRFSSVSLLLIMVPARSLYPMSLHKRNALAVPIPSMIRIIYFDFPRTYIRYFLRSMLNNSRMGEAMQKRNIVMYISSIIYTIVSIFKYVPEKYAFIKTRKYYSWSMKIFATSYRRLKLYIGNLCALFS